MFQQRGQTILEYTIIVGIVVAVLAYMGTGIKRGVQSIVKVTADQIGNQSNADQDFNTDQGGGYTQASVTQTAGNTLRGVTESGYVNSQGNTVYMMNTVYNESTLTNTLTNTQGGFIPDQ
ncbi:MAG: hypothetical protein HQL13_04590 [Candidatus Omnitrophica bacterium]|nr:hypothetical protein [Candidatus Omnitrophota bacterium]